MSAHKCFTVAPTAYLQNLSRAERRKECFAINYQREPTLDANGKTRALSLTIPLLLVTDFVTGPEDVGKRVAEILNAHWEPPKARPLDEWHEDMGDVLWWKFPLSEAPWVGSPLATDWPRYHTHFTPLPQPPADPDEQSEEAESC